MEQMSSIEQIYNSHHKKQRGEGFAILKDERGGFLKEKIGTGKKVLDLGCRDGALTKYFCENNEVLGVDIDSEAMERAEKQLGIKIKKIDLNGEWGLPENNFDIVVAAEVIEHLYHPEILMQKIKKVLKDDGAFVGSIPYAFSLQSRIKMFFAIKTGTPFQDPTHINHFSYKEFSDLLRKNFKEVEIRAIVPARYKIFTKLFPYLFAHDFLFIAKSKIINL